MRVFVYSGESLEEKHTAELCSGLLKQSGFQLGQEAEVRIIAANARGCLPYLAEKSVIVGTFSKEEMEAIREPFEHIAFLGVHNIAQLPPFVENLAQGTAVDLVSEQKVIPLHLPRIRLNSAMGLIQTHHLFNSEAVSHPLEDILKEAKHAIAEGCKELVLIGDSARYGTEQIWRSGIPEVVKSIIALPGDFELRIACLGAKHLKPVLNEILNLMAHMNVYKHLHVPFISGSDEVLKTLNLGYTVEDIREIYERFKGAFPRGTFSTEIIVGWEHETIAQFNHTLEALGKIRPEMIDVRQAIEGRNASDRVKLTMNTFHHVLRLGNERWLDWKGDIRMMEKGIRDEWIGRNIFWKPFNIKGSYQPGTKFTVRADTIIGDDLRGEIVR